MTVVIDLAGPDEFPAIQALLERNALPVDGLREHLSTTLVAHDDGTVIGSVALEVYGQVALLRSVAVEPGRQGHGLGRRLTAAALDLARRQGVQRAYLLTETAQNYFPRFGFQPVARAAVDPAIHGSVEWASACPASA